ncbi:MAG: hypothetical protein ACLUMK_09420, partial [Christensenellales bacterium]
ATPQQLGFIASAIAENAAQTTRKTVGQAVADGAGRYTMDVTLPKPGEYIVEFASGTSYANYGVTYENGATPEPTAQPMPTAEPVKEGAVWASAVHHRPAGRRRGGGLRRVCLSPQDRGSRGGKSRRG